VIAGGRPLVRRELGLVRDPAMLQPVQHLDSGSGPDRRAGARSSRAARCWTAAIDTHLNEVGDFIPGLSDVGAKIFGTKDDGSQ